MTEVVPTKPAAPKKTGVLSYVWKQAEYFGVGRHEKPILSIILHSTEGHITGDLATLETGGGRKVSVHWYVTRTGKIYHFVQDADTANHAGVVIAARYGNTQSLGIEQEHMIGEDYPEIQVQTAANLCAYLQQKHGLLEITSHAHAAAPPGRKTDPAAYLWADFHKYLIEAMLTTWSVREVKA